jgi:transposase
MPETRRKFDPDFRAGAVRIVRESGKPIAHGARDLGINEGTLGNWVIQERRAREPTNGGLLSEDERAELARLRRENGHHAPSPALLDLDQAGLDGAAECGQVLGRSTPRARRRHGP